MPNQVRFRSARVFALQGFAEVDYSLPRLLGYVSNGLFTRQPPYRLLDQPDFPGAQIRSQSWRATEACRFTKRNSHELRRSPHLMKMYPTDWPWPTLEVQDQGVLRRRG